MVQSGLLALGVVPLWRIARRVADLRVGASLVLLSAYALYPAIHDLNTAGFHPAVLALPALLGMALFGLTGRWWLFGACAVVAVLTRADLALVTAAFGGLLVLEGRRRAGLITMGVSVAYVVVALLVIQPYYNDGAFVHAIAFEHYGSSPLGALGGLLAHPFRALGDLIDQQNFEILVMLFAPVFFLPFVAPRYLLPVVPLECLYLIANVSEERVARPEHAVAITAFIFVATAIGLSKIGRRSVERVNVDRRVLIALVFASAVFFVQDSPASPYEEPWAWGVRDVADQARLDAADLVPDRRLGAGLADAACPCWPNAPPSTSWTRPTTPTCAGPPTGSTPSSWTPRPRPTGTTTTAAASSRAWWSWASTRSSPRPASRSTNAADPQAVASS